VTVADDMWVTASTDLAAEQRDRLVAVAQVRNAELWPFLAAAGSEVEYGHRRALAMERIEAACASVAPGDPDLLRQVLAGLDADFRALHAARAPERELAEQVRAELGRRTATVSTPAPGSRRQAATEPAGEADPEAAAQAELDEAEQVLSQPEPLSMGAPRTAGHETWEIVSPGGTRWSSHDSREEAEEAHAKLRSSYQAPGMSNIMPNPAHFRVQKAAYGAGTADVDCPKCGGTGEMPAQYVNSAHRGPAPDCDLCGGEGITSQTEAHGWHTSSRTAAVRHTAPGGGEHAPYRLKQSDGGWYVVNDKGERKNEEPKSREDARQLQQALYANVPGARESAEQDERRKAASRTMAAVMRDIACSSCGRQARVDISQGSGASPTPCPHCGSTEVHLAETSHNRHSMLRAVCAKCQGGCTPDGAACGYCDGAGALTPTTAAIKAADGWDQGLVRISPTGAVSFDPDAFGSERWQKLPGQPEPTWINDEWGPSKTNVPPVGAEPNPLAQRPAPTGRELTDTRSYRPLVRAAFDKEANPYSDDNPYLTAGPGHPGQPDTNLTDDGQQPPDQQRGADRRRAAPEEVPLASGAAQPLVRDDILPHPKDEIRSGSSRRPDPAFVQSADVVDRLAARVLAANVGCSPADARRVARATLARFPAVAEVGRGRGR
jgi:hypothetical protein